MNNNNIINNNIIIDSIPDLDENSIDRYIKYEYLNNNINNSFIYNNNYNNYINNENNINNNNISYTEIKLTKNKINNNNNNLIPFFLTDFKNKYKTDYNFNNYKNKKDNLDDSYLKKEIRNNQSKLL